MENITLNVLAVPDLSDLVKEGTKCQTTFKGS